jgi:molybdopterin-guanine dinucleotide biosynthesis protein A
MQLIEGCAMAARFLIAAGRPSDHRWKWYRGVAKQLVDVGGERLIERTIRQFSPFGEVVVVHGDAGPLPVDIRQVKAENDPKLGDINGICNARRYWSQSERTTVVLGDVWFTDAAVAKIVAPRTDWCLYGRPNHSAITGKKSDEQFAVGFQPSEQAAVLAAAEQGGRLTRARRIRWTRFPQWFHLMHGLTDPKRVDRAPDVSLGHFEVIDDQTDDIDKPEDYDRLLERLALVR